MANIKVWDTLSGDLMKGKRGVIMGIANHSSIAWGIADALAKQGAEMAFTYQNEKLKKRVEPLAKIAGVDCLIECDVTNSVSVENCFDLLKQKFGKIDFLVHAIAFSDKDELRGRYVDTSRNNFRMSMDISCFSFVEASKYASALMTDGGSIITLTYLGSERVVPSYNVMGVCKAALEASTRYIAKDLGSQKIRVNAISAGPMKTLAGSAIGGARDMYNWVRDHSPLKEETKMESVAGSAVFLLSDLGSSVSGEVLHVDSGYHSVAMPDLEQLKS